MREVGIDIADRKPKKPLREMQLHADWAVTMGCGDACPFVPATVEEWDIPDPAGRPLEEVRVIRDAVEARVRRLLAERADAIRADRTAHELRLARLLPRWSPSSRAGARKRDMRVGLRRPRQRAVTETDDVLVALRSGQALDGLARC